MSEQIPVNPKVLRWARETAGYSIEDLITKFNRKRVTAAIVEDWEEGNSSPSYEQLERLAYEIFKRPLALFFFPEPPDEETPRQSFRTLPQEEIDLMEPRLLYLIRRAKVMQENLKELFNEENPATKKIHIDIRISPSDSVSDTAKTVRKYLDVNIKKQYALKSNDEALKFWRDVIEQYGVFVFKDAFKEEECSGFCLYDSQFPVIYLNNSQPKIRQIFTVFHELAHILFKTGGIDFRNNDFVNNMSGNNKRIEVFCNKFAGEFLVPSGDFKPHIHNQEISDNLLDQLAKKFSVSREVILRKCLDLNYIDSHFYETKVKKWEVERLSRQSPSSGGNPYLTKGAYLGHNYIDTAFGKYYQGLISKTQLADYLGMKEAHINKFEGYVLHKG
ncbi:MAG: ImmA/IrrE family metallo-endopeptidase [Sedimentisphaerales bacterium]|nr:ImmA/IrrE family metallo-endopeptidase [Sedimentisphaerales bacterium]